MQTLNRAYVIGILGGNLRRWEDCGLDRKGLSTNRPVKRSAEAVARLEREHDIV